jgi:adenosylcobinamide-phosphate synthase
LAGYLADLAVGDPRRWHPVAGFGRVAARLERSTYADNRPAGVLHVGVLVGIITIGAAMADRALAARPVWRTVFTALATWTVLGGRSLLTEAAAVGNQLEQGDLAMARRQITHLVGRDPSALDAYGIARACAESVAENTSDAVVGPLFWGAVGGPAGLLGYRAINTLDAMVGHRSPRYRRFGWAAARLDDAANLLPARLCASVVVLLAPMVGGRPAAALRVVQRDAGRHPSPNAGPVEAAFAGALGVTLGGVNTYGTVTEDRGTLGDGDPPVVADIDRAGRLSAAVGAVVAALAVLVGLRRPGRR